MGNLLESLIHEIEAKSGHYAGGPKASEPTRVYNLSLQFFFNKHK